MQPARSTTAMRNLVLQLISGLTSPEIYLPGFLIGWFARRWWHVALGVIAIDLLTDLETAIAYPDMTLEWSSVPVSIVLPLIWCAAGLLVRRWVRSQRARRHGPIRPAVVLASMLIGAASLCAVALGLGLLWLRLDELAEHTYAFGAQPQTSAHDTIFFQYLFPALLLGQLVGGLIGRILARRVAAAA